MDYPILYRKRLIPMECIQLKDDEILHLDKEVLITKWITLKPRPDFHHGYSCYLFKEGFKISKFYRNDGTFLYWYCDIVSFDYEKNTNSLYVTDLLADVIITPDDHTRVLDLDELCTAKEKGLLSDREFFISIKRLGALLKIIEERHFSSLSSRLEAYIQ